MRPAVRRQQAVHQRLQAVGLVDDDLGVFVRSLLDLHLQQLRRATDAAQRVLDLVRQVADQLLVGLRLVDQALFAVLPACCSSGSSSTMISPGCSVCATITCTGSGSWFRRLSQAS
jgi:hypothetical protein